MSVRVGITRPDLGGLAARLTPHAVELVHVPLIALAEAADGGVALRAALDRLDDFDWVVVTSAAGARAVGAAVGPSPVRLAAVGAATARVLTELAGRPVDLVPGVATGAALAVAFPEHPGRVLVAQAAAARPELVDGLRARGIDVEAVEAYRTERAPLDHASIEALAGCPVAYFASPSAVEAWVAAGLAPPPAPVAIGTTTAAAIVAAGWPEPAVAASPADADVAAAILAATAGFSAS